MSYFVGFCRVEPARQLEPRGAGLHLRVVGRN